MNMALVLGLGGGGLFFTMMTVLIILANKDARAGGFSQNASKK